ncbi:BRCA1-A complex subunit Abraxas 1 isoform X1 [Sphaeramia orbicularis]|uniref:BRCA1-A complex subunit Abraxas 1 isoform X1 n=1 Tax=Sphaeramia orbicularis TaxID=375764 RepID=UPI00117E1741|nr:BRCA1-A complex subunit Abraxas 1 isoform X1 [Sphaeramia orbicularis]
MAEPTVRMSGIVLSSLMFQHLNSDSDVEGLILGESRFEEQVTISDTQSDHIHIEEIYNIQKHIACQKLQNFYNSVGEVDQDAIKRILADNKQESVIGWYRQRRNTDQQMALREKIVHENLKSVLSNPHMIFLLLTPSKLTSPGSTHRTEYAAFISRSRQVINVPVLVNNLGLLEQVAYCKVSALCSAVGYNLTMKKHRSEFFSSNGLLRDVNEVNKMSDSLQSELQKACEDVEKSERLLEALQADVSDLRRRVREKRQNGLEKADADDLPVEPKRNLLLHDAVRALFTCGPLFQSQTLTLDAFPVLDFSHSPEHSANTATEILNPETQSSEQPVSELHPGRTVSRKRLIEFQVGREHKRMKT